MYNLGTGNGTSVLEMVDAFEKASGKVKKKDNDAFFCSWILDHVFVSCLCSSLELVFFSSFQKIPLVTAGRRPGDAEVVYASTERAESR